MENYPMNRSCGRPYHATCGMAKVQPPVASCRCEAERNRQSCACRLPGTVTKNAEMYTHADHLEPAMAYVPWQQWQTTYPPERGLIQGTIFPDLDLKFAFGGCSK